jgi:hypothetical protein
MAPVEKGVSDTKTFTGYYGTTTESRRARESVHGKHISGYSAGFQQLDFLYWIPVAR